MKRVSDNDDDQIFRLMANYEIDKPIKISYVFEDGDSDETDTVENSKLPENPAQHASPQNKNTNSSTEHLNTTVSDHNCYSNISFDDLENAEENYNRSLQNQHTVSYAMSNPKNEIDKMLNHNYLNDRTFNDINIQRRSNENPQYLNLLDTLSENVIMIAKYYHFYDIQKYSKNQDQKSKQYYKDQKSYYYHQSYNILVAVILPQEHNQIFIRDFINRTIEIANQKLCYNIYIRSLKHIFLDMIQWAKQKKNYSEARINRSQYPMSRPPPPPYSTSVVNTGQLMNMQASASLGSSIPTSPSACYNSNDARQQIYGPPVSHVPLNVPVQPPLYSTCNTNTRQAIMRPPPISIPPSVPTLLQASNIFSNANIQQPKNTPPSVSLVRSDQTVTQQSSFSNSNSNTRQPGGIPPPGSLMPSVLPEIQPSYYTVSNTDTRQPMTSASVRGLLVSSASNNITNSNSNQRTPADHDSTVCLFSTGPPGGELSISIDAAIAKIINDVKSSNKTRKALSSRPSKKRRKTNDIESPTLLSTSSTLISPVQNQPQENNYNCPSRNQPPVTSNAGSVNTTMEPAIYTNQFCPGEKQNHKDFDNNESHPPLLSRSESRDSGFWSPILLSTATNDYNNMVYPHSTDNQEITLKITHVTSMNPDAAFFTSATCKVCGTNTRYKCIACFNVYYCGFQCQTVDWPLHKYDCKAS
ncbi:uncharacterized protein LOC123872655 [Maniola jurtina]|uniref:uncharacterized protein LOC123872655 n=1 Tax=Maniola jurtina TaxID=191418 RepID=UPI001E68A05C|nr:uncharacterized protein LOC123872655 [Maniola jurtina]XP_045773038.1 uncharacterized protein LOC123872655 [Maniola jurtina]XP_045773039.1 uncharacterized protein LOC123872655 [Maniola jurtina]